MCKEPLTWPHALRLLNFSMVTSRHTWWMGASTKLLAPHLAGQNQGTTQPPLLFAPTPLPNTWLPSHSEVRVDFESYESWGRNAIYTQKKLNAATTQHLTELLFQPDGSTPWSNVKMKRSSLSRPAGDLKDAALGLITGLKCACISHHCSHLC